MSEYNRVARKKILEFHLSEDFIGIIDSSVDDLTMKFLDKVCTIDKFGRVTWLNSTNQH